MLLLNTIRLPTSIVKSDLSTAIWIIIFIWRAFKSRVSPRGLPAWKDCCQAIMCKGSRSILHWNAWVIALGVKAKVSFGILTLTGHVLYVHYSRLEALIMMYGSTLVILMQWIINCFINFTITLFIQSSDSSRWSTRPLKNALSISNLFMSGKYDRTLAMYWPCTCTISTLCSGGITDDTTCSFDRVFRSR